MKKTLTAGFASLILAGALATPAQALTVSGVDVPDTYSAMGQELQLNGAGARSKWFMDLYVGGLYVAEKVSDGQAVINADEPQAITLHITSGMITSERMTEATMDGFKSSTDGDLSAIQSDVDQFMSVFQEEIKEGDVFDLVYAPGEGVHVLKNGEQKDTVGDLEFKKALFGIWLSDNPAQKDLKNKMLGQN
ncbi:chalcone isomerase family protein [Marinobacter sp. G11]|uniref:chalcone isomerase family protein n=1 Tax=Marinobacter sp. G11 TaxID=2903522 RepID=UPI001E465EAD|nr:chalcone isomerase family protein [Marinobacter sp. G11]MCE0759832.1 chalcone isomerase family protein [Marinobacter sp. G11]